MSRDQDWSLLPAGVTWTSPPLVSLSLDRAAIEGRFGPPCETDCDSNGVGHFDAWCIRFACGLEVALWHFHQEGLPQGWEVHSNQRDADHILFHLGAPVQEPSRGDPHACPPVRPRFRVVRLDDNGNTFEVGLFTSRCEAVAVARTYEGRGHKQTYWVEQPGE